MTGYLVRVKGWSGKPYVTTDGECTTYHPGTEFGWKHSKMFSSLEEAEAWLRDHHVLSGDYTIVAKEI